MKPAEFAQLVVETYIKEGKTPRLPEHLEGIDIDKAGTFVSIKTANNELRGCIGTIFPTEDSVIKEIVNNAISASTKDPRFDPISRSELQGLKYSVDILFPPEPVTSIDQLDPKVYGIIVASRSGRQALLLPDLEGIDTAEVQLGLCKRKAGIPQEEPVAVQRFKVIRYTE